MKPDLLIGYCDASEAAWLASRAEETLEAWPDRRCVPAFESREMSSLNALSDDEPIGGVVVVDGRSLDSRDQIKLMDRLHTAEAAGIVLVDGTASADGQSVGSVLVRDATTSAEVLAATLQAVCACERSAGDLRRELLIAQRTTGGVREEMSRISQELSLASRIQQELVPERLPDVQGMDFGVLYRPAGYVSGDIYNVAQLDDRRTGFFIADAVGHGVPAALLTMIISRSLPMLSTRGGGELIEPADALATLNDELCNVSDGTPRFATAVYGIVDTVSGHVRIANAGHPQPMRINAERVAKVEAGGPLLGVFREASFEEETFTLEPGETLLLYSDGFETAFPDADAVLQGRGILPSNRYVEQLLSIGRRSRKSGDTVVEALSTLEQRLDEAQGSLHQADDVTALALERKAA
ncbi:MAG: PP2C family protein-serine/threonine phosphatase [Planctomycetota bacterium]